MYIGADYYPEHWPASRWETDAKLMKKAGFNVVRMAEFAWVKMEPEEGVFEFEWLDRALEILGRQGIKAILGTPTGSMPAWVARTYPEVIHVKKDGMRDTWGVRKQNCLSSAAYRRLSERITRAMAVHYADNPTVIGWQTDNEFGHPFCYCETCRAAFQSWLRTGYGSLDELNRAWGTHFWGHTVGTWGEITIPVDTGSHNPGASLDWHRFFSWQNVRFQHDQVEILRACCPAQFITHNLMGLFKEIDYYDLSADLDFVSWDNYPVWGRPAVRYDASYAADVMRGVKGRNFWIMETTAGPCGWGVFGPNIKPGEMRSVAYQQIGRGCDGYVWFRWRTCTAGREQYWHGLLSHDGKPGRRYREAAAVARELHALAGRLDGTTVRPDVAIIYDYDSLWAMRIQPGYPGADYQRAIGNYYNALFRAGVNADMIRPDADFSAYRLVLAPHLYLLADDVAARLDAYVKSGGVLLADCRTGVKDRDNLCHARTLPGRLSAALGIEIPEYEAIPDECSYPVKGSGALAGEYTAVKYADWIVPRGADALAACDVWHLKKYAAVTRNAYGKGAGWYSGVVAKESAFYDALVAAALKDAGVKALVTPPEGVEVSVREGKGRRLLFIVNHTDREQTVRVPAGRTDVLTGRKTGGELRLGRYGAAVLAAERRRVR
ncbi:beta-galactosidase [bacterium]|nr:beta-galactosidase [bacterium]